MELYYERISNMCTRSLPKVTCAYVISHMIDESHIEKYVGSTKNIYNIMHGHCNKNIIYIDLYITNDIEFAESLERVLIKLIIPSTNKLTYSLSDGEVELMNKLLDNDELKKCILDDTVKIEEKYLKCVIGIEKIKHEKIEYKTLSVDKRIYNFVQEKRQELIKINNGNNVEIGLVAEIAILEGLDKVVNFYKISKMNEIGFITAEHGLGKAKEELRT